MVKSTLGTLAMLVVVFAIALEYSPEFNDFVYAILDRIPCKVEASGG